MEGCNQDTNSKSYNTRGKKLDYAKMAKGNYKRQSPQQSGQRNNS